MPCLLIKDKGLVKTVKFKDGTYVGDPINATHIFNEEWVDEIVFLDITATKNVRHISTDLISRISDECFMPLTVGGGIRNCFEIQELLRAGAEKVAINTAAIENPSIVDEASRAFGSQSIVVSLDAKRRKDGQYFVYTRSGTTATGMDPVDVAKRMEDLGAGEILINSIDRDGTWTGYDLELIRSVSTRVTIPVVACGGARDLDDLDGPSISGTRQLWPQEACLSFTARGMRFSSTSRPRMK